MDIGLWSAVVAQLIPVGLATANWVLSLFLAPKTNNYLPADVKQLWSDSRPFIKTQWPFVAICMVGSNMSQAHLFADHGLIPSFSFGLVAAAFISAGILPIIKLFYVSYLAAPKYPGRVATIGLWTVLLYVLGEWLISALGGLGMIFFVIPGLLVMVRASLFLPAFALEGHHPFAAFEKSWALTSGKYWLVSRYLGLPAILFLLLSASPQLTATVKAIGHYHFQYFGPAMITINVATLAMSLILAGLTYKLYDRLMEAAAERSQDSST